MERKLQGKLRYTVCKAEEDCLKNKYRFYLSMREDLTDLLCLESSLRKICIIDDDAFDI